MHASRHSLQTPIMRTPKTFMTLGVLSVLLVALSDTVAAGPNEFGRTLANLSNADRAAMDRARTEVLSKLQQGAVSVWKDDKTGHSGEARIARTYAQNGMMCAEVDHFLKLPNESHYVIPFCRDTTGAWRAVF
jgi:hypothetical protein